MVNLSYRKEVIAMKPVYVFGHKHPDTDAVCAAISLANLKNELGVKSEPKVIGPISRETEFVLNYFGVKKPSYLNDVKVQVSDIKYVKKAYINENDSILNAFNLMHDLDITAIPIIDDKKMLTGYVTLKNMAIYLITNNRRYVNTSMDHLLNALNAKSLTKFKDTFEGNISSVTFSSDTFMKEEKLDDKSIIIVGDRYKIIEYAINSKVELIILSGNMTLPFELLTKAKKNKVSIISSKYSSFELCNRLSLANYIKTINETPNPVTLDVSSYYSDFLVMARKLNYTNYPIINKKHECIGLLRVTDVANYEKKKVILVDHNNYEQSVDGLAEADILEVFDHHNIGNIGTNNPIYFTGRPVGCTCTIIYDKYKEEKVKVSKEMAGIMLSAIISDTLLFTSPTTTAKDKEYAEELAKIAKVDIESYGTEMFKAAGSIEGLTPSELINGDFKAYNINDKNYGVACITTLEFDKINSQMSEYVAILDEMCQKDYAAVLVFVTNIVKQGSYVIYNSASEDLVSSAFDLKNVKEGTFIKGVVSRKKQMIPPIMKELEK